MYSLNKSWGINHSHPFLPLSWHGFKDLRPLLNELFVEKHLSSLHAALLHWSSFIVLMVCPFEMKILNEEQFTSRSSEESSGLLN